MVTRASIRPSSLRIAARETATTIPYTVFAREYSHRRTLVSVRVGAEALRVSGGPFASVEIGDTAHVDWAGAQVFLFSPEEEAELPETLSRKELVRRAGRPLSEDDLDTLNALGIVFPTKQGKYEVAVAHLSVGVALLDLGMPFEAALAAQDIFTKHGREIADELTELFRTQVWPAYKETGASPEELRQVVEKFKPVTIAALVTAYESAVDQTKRETVARRTR